MLTKASSYPAFNSLHRVLDLYRLNFRLGALFLATGRRFARTFNLSALVLVLLAFRVLTWFKNTKTENFTVL